MVQLRSFVTAVGLLLLATNITGLTESLDDIIEKGCNYTTRITDYKGDYVIGSVFPVHYKNIQGLYQLYGYAISWVEAFLYAIDAINKNNTLLPGVTLGYDIRESCDSHHDVIMSNVVDFVLKDEKNESQCKCDVTQNGKILAVLGANTFASTDLMSHMLTPNVTPLISYSATSPVLSDKTKYPTFSRTVPSAKYETKVLVDIFRHFNWSYVSALASDDDAGRETLQELEKDLNRYNMCIAVSNLFDPLFPGRDLENLISKLESVYNKTKVVALWSKKSDGLKLIARAVERGLTELTWVTTWGLDTALTYTNDSQGIIDIQINDVTVPDYKQYSSTIKWESPLGNPWFAQFGEALGLGAIKQYITLGQIIAADRHFNVMQGPYAIANALHKVLECNNETCPLKGKPINKKEFFNYIDSVKFTVPSTNIVSQLKDSLAGISYKISMYEPDYRAPTTTRQAIYSTYTPIGKWKGGMVYIDQKDIQWRGGVKPRARCSDDCLVGKHRPVMSSACCWECVKCEKDKISTQINQAVCQACDVKQMSDDNHTKCVDLKDRTISINNTSVQILLAFSLLGVILVLFVIGIVLKCWNTPVVKSSSREITLIQLVSMLLLFLLPFLYFIPLSPTMCALQTIMFSTFYSQIVAFIVLKTYRLLCVFKDIRFTKVSKYLHSQYQILFGFILVALQLLILIIWYFINPVEITIDRVREEKCYSYYCIHAESANIGPDTILYSVIGYIYVLSLASGFMAFRARKLPQNFNEAQFIWFAMFTSCLAWLLFIPVYLSTSRYNKPLAFLIINLVSTFCLLFILNGYKIAIILFYPHLNSKEHFQKIAKNATVTTFLKEIQPTNGQTKPRSREVSVISFDFDGMFDEYRNMQQNSMTLPTRRSHFPSMRRALNKLSNRRRKLSKGNFKERTKTVFPLGHDERHPVFQNKSASYDEIQVRKQKLEKAIELESLKSFQFNVNGVIKQNELSQKELEKKNCSPIKEEPDIDFSELNERKRDSNHSNASYKISNDSTNSTTNLIPKVSLNGQYKVTKKKKKSSLSLINLEMILKSPETYL